MADDTQTGVETPVNDTQVAPTPSAVQQTTEQVVDTTVSDGLPESASDRTRARVQEVLGKAEMFEQELRVERQRREALESAFKSMQPKVGAPEPIYDPNTGLLNEQVFNDVQKKAYEAEQRALKAEQAVQGYLADQENRRAYETHPELNPDAKQFDKELHKKARAVLLDSMMNPQDYGGKQLSLKDAGDYLKGNPALESAVAQARREGASEAIEQLTPKEQAALEATGASSRRTEVATNLDTLRFQTRKGNIGATMERMNALKGQA